MLKTENGQSDLYGDLLESLIPMDNTYRRLLKLIDFSSLCKDLHDCYSKDKGADGYPIEQGFKCLFLQYFENISDRRMEDYLRFNTATKYFCGFNLIEPTPDHSFLGKLRKRIGLEKLIELFNKVVQQLEDQNIVSNAFHFVDSTAITSKISLWEEYDKARAKEAPKRLCNENIDKYAKDKDARIGCKGKNKFWFGYKRHQRVDMSSGIITDIKITPANVNDSKAAPEILPRQGMVIADKAYDTNTFREQLKARNLHDGVIKKNNRKDKNRDKDKWISSMRMPFEGLFGHAVKRTKYIGIAKVSFHQYFDAFTQNMKRLLKIQDKCAYLAIKIT